MEISSARGWVNGWVDYDSVLGICMEMGPTPVPGPRPRPSPGALMAGDRPREVDRIVFFSDAMFAIAITLLVVGIAPPGGPDAQVDSRLLGLLPRFFGFVLSFLGVLQFWIGHHRIFEHVIGYDTALLWRNGVHLLIISLLPFPTAVMGEHLHATAAVVFCAVTLFVASSTGFGVWWYAVGRDGMLGDVDPAVRRVFMARSIVTPPVFLVGIGRRFSGDPGPRGWRCSRPCGCS